MRETIHNIDHIDRVEKYVALKEMLKMIAKTMIKNKGVFLTVNDDVEVDEELEKHIESNGWKVVYEPWFDGSTWIIPKALEKYIDGLILAIAHDYLTAEQVNDLLAKAYGVKERGRAVLVREFMNDFEVEAELRDTHVNPDYTGHGLICIDDQCIRYEFYYCNELYDEYGNPTVSGVFKCTDYEFMDKDME